MRAASARSASRALSSRRATLTGGALTGCHPRPSYIALTHLTRSLRRPCASSTKYSLAFSALLQGHDTWVTSLHFSPPSPTTPLQLLSASADNSLILWAPHPSSSAEAPIWFPQNRFGQVSVKGLGFFGALWAGADGAREVLASGWAGGWNVWREAADPAAPGGWKELMGPTGHFDGVKSVAWGGKAGEWLVSVSSDETTRIHAPWVRAGARTWAEIARPQVHGYPLTSLAPLPGSHGFVSGADEKVVRVFGETRGFLESLVGLGAMAESDVGDAPVGASVPPLGLSNKMVSTEGQSSAGSRCQKGSFADLLPVLHRRRAGGCRGGQGGRRLQLHPLLDLASDDGAAFGEQAVDLDALARGREAVWPRLRGAADALSLATPCASCIRD
jgi:WD40 repeat protein